MRRLSILIVVCILIIGCQGLPGVTAVAPITNIGDEAEAITNIQNTDHFAWLMALIGWVAPSPAEIWKGFRDFILRLFGRL